MVVGIHLGAAGAGISKMASSGFYSVMISLSVPLIVQESS